MHFIIGPYFLVQKYDELIFTVIWRGYKTTMLMLMGSQNHCQCRNLPNANLDIM